MSELTEAPAPFDINLDAAAAAWKELQGSKNQEFSWVVFTFPENLFAKCLEVHHSTKGGITEMGAKIQALTNNSKACWGAFKVHAVNQSDFQQHAAKFIGFQFVPAGCKINAKRMAKDILPLVEKVLSGVDYFVDATAPEELSDSRENCVILAEKLQLSSDQALQCHAVADVAPVSAAYSTIRQCSPDDFSYILVVPHLGIERTFDIVTSNEGGLTEMIEHINARMESPIFGAYKVQSVDATAVNRTAQFVKFVFANKDTREKHSRVIAEMRPYVLGAMDTQYVRDISSSDEFCDSSLATLLGLTDQTLQFHSVRNVEEAGASLQAVRESDRDEFPYVVLTTSENAHTRDLLVRKSNEGGLEEMLAAVREICASGRPSYGLFKVQAMDDSSFARKKPIRTKFIGFRCVPGANESVAEINPYVARILDELTCDMFIKTDDMDDIGNTMVIADHLRLDDAYTCYEFGGEITVRTSVLLKVDKDGKETVEAAHTMNAWCRVVSNERKESFAIFALTPDRKRLDVVCEGCGHGLKACQVATNVTLKLRKPTWGVFRVQGQDEENNRAASRVKYVGFQVVPPDCLPSVVSTVHLIKPLLRDIFKQATYWIEAESLESFNEEEVTKKLTDMSGAEHATKFDFGSELSAEDEDRIVKTVEKHLEHDASATPA